MTKHKMSEAEETIRRAAMINGNPLPSNFKIGPVSAPVRTKKLSVLINMSNVIINIGEFNFFMLATRST